MEIVLFGSKRDRRLSDFILTQLDKHYDFLYVADSAVKKHRKEELVIRETDTLHSVDDNDCLIILKSNANLSHLKLVNKPFIVIDVDNEKQMKKIVKSDYPVIACGISNKNSLTFSSIGSEKSVICLQRGFTLFNKPIEPMEIPVEHFPKHNQYAMLCYAVIALALESDIENISLNFK